MNGASIHTTGSTSFSLLGRVRSHDPVAWQRFADIYTPLVYAWARRGGLRENDAADIVQEVFRTVAAKIGDFGKGHEKSSFRGWLWAITRNQVRLYYRRIGAQPEATGGTDAAQAFAQIPDWDDQWNANSNPNETTAIVQRVLQLVRADFGENTWQAFWRLAVEGHTAAEIANDLKMTDAAVRQCKYRVLCRLREELYGL